MNIQHKNIAIIGGGPGGLTLARLLQLKGANVKVYERDVNAAVRVQGGALDLHAESGLAALTKAGLMDEFKTHYRPGAELVRVTDSQLAVYADQHAEITNEKFGDKNYRPEIDRGPLREILLNSLLPGTVVWDSHIVSIEQIQDTWRLVFKNGNTIMADLVIGADGANSKIRPFVTGIKPYWTGITMLEGSLKDGAKTAPVIHQLLKGGKIFAYGNQKTLIVSSKGDGSFGFAVSFKSDEFWAKESGVNFNDNQQVLAWFKKEFAEWNPAWWELFESADTLFIPRPQYCMPLDQKWDAKPNITLLGDAAHWMPPFAGEGVNMAMLDALQLSEALTDAKFSDTRQAIAHYEKQMFARFGRIGQATLFNTEWMHQPDALKQMLAMFGKNKLKQGLFIGNYLVKVMVMPAIRKAIGLPPVQKILR
ncbi:FAD-dependent oxidoreductase [Mucilaginibacter ginsenosidivorax]|uniref:Flavin-dependent monooxygenase n=1 Tax=Mucilaginibacter ginsenosidivorax TaxID=862126 RepID=A0A5B8VYW8_9SPHI|nr:NAD(P)/FAD-dependent oxidoreductase [Mucilaginibacter ginsenosidivorax]QEC76767.1 FAD-dependent monooxygenase [Mucilaginibacter ginsenosidivorax]